MTLGSINQLGRRKNLRDDPQIPSIVEGILIRLAGKLAEAFEEGDTDRIVGEIVLDTDNDFGEYPDGDGRGAFNMIPSSSNRRGCTELLITFCFKNDSFEKRLRESLDHVSQHCRNTKDIYFISTKWNSSAFEKFDGYLEMVRGLPVNVFFIYVGKEGFVLMPE